VHQKLHLFALQFGVFATHNEMLERLGVVGIRIRDHINN